MADLILTTYDWVPEPPRGYVRDIRVRWALEEAGLPYRVESTPFRDRGAGHLARQPFGQVPWLTDGDLSIFESGAIVQYIGEQSEALLPRDSKGRFRAIQWTYAALNSVEPAILNLPLTDGAAVWTEPGSRAQIDIGINRVTYREVLR